MGENTCKGSKHQGLISKVYKQLMQLNIKRQTKQSNQKMGRRHRYFSEENIQMSSKLKKRCSTSLIIKEMQIKLQ